MKRNKINPEVLALIKKIEFNSYFPLYANNYFMLFDANLTARITAKGKRLL